MDVLKKYEQKIEDVMKDNAEKISRCNSRIEALKAVIEKSGADMVTATENVDVEGYKLAKRAKEDAADELAMLSGRVAQLEAEPMMKSEEYFAMRKELIAEQDKMYQAYKKKFAPMIREILAAGEAAGALDERIDAMLVLLQRKVMKREAPAFTEINDSLDAHSIVWFANNVRDSAEENGLM